MKSKMPTVLLTKFFSSSATLFSPEPALQSWDSSKKNKRNGTCPARRSLFWTTLQTKSLLLSLIQDVLALLHTIWPIKHKYLHSCWMFFWPFFWETKIVDLDFVGYSIMTPSCMHWQLAEWFLLYGVSTGVDIYYIIVFIPETRPKDTDTQFLKETTNRNKDRGKEAIWTRETSRCGQNCICQCGVWRTWLKKRFSLGNPHNPQITGV